MAGIAARESVLKEPAELRRQYEVERALAERLRRAPPERRRALYGEIYEELFRRFPELAHEADGPGGVSRRAQAELELQLLEPYIVDGGVAVEFGAGDGLVSRRLAERMGRVLAVEAAPRRPDGSPPPANLEVGGVEAAAALTDGSVDLAYSCHFVEHLHPEDLRSHLREVARLLRPGASYVCITPNRLLGPHDVSRHFDPVATGLHLAEYSHRELAAAMRVAGLSRVAVVRRLGGHTSGVTTALYLLAELAVAVLPRRLRQALLSSPVVTRRRRPFRPFEQVKLAASK